MTENNKDGANLALTAFMDGQGITPVHAKSLERTLRNNPDNKKGRALLLGFYSANRTTAGLDRLVEHLVWMIEKHPTETVLELIYVSSCDPQFINVSRCWTRVLSRCRKTQVLNNAAMFFRQCYAAYSDRLWRELQERDPNNPRWPCERAKLYLCVCEGHREQEYKSPAQKAIALGTQAVTLYISTPNDYPFLDRYATTYIEELTQLALNFDFFEEAEYLAQCLLSVPQKLSRAKQADDIDSTIILNAGSTQLAHGLLGKIALLRGDILTAKHELERMGESPAYIPQNLELAQAMLDLNEQALVFRFLETCIAKIDQHLARPRICVAPSQMQDFLDRRLDSHRTRMVSALSELTHGRKPSLLFTRVSTDTSP
jgi:hypothetical protein